MNAYGSIKFDLDFDGAGNFTGQVVSLSGNALVPPVGAISGSYSCSLSSLSGVIGLGGPSTVHFLGSFSAGGTQFSGSFTSDATTTGSYGVGLISNLVSTSGTALTTDPGHTGATPAVPVQASVTSPNDGVLSLGQAPFPPPAAAGYDVVGYALLIDAPLATSDAPITLSFEVYAGVAPSGKPVVFHNGVAIPDCATQPATVASPDPCVSTELQLPNGNWSITVLTSSASVWTFGVPSSAVVRTVIAKPGVAAASRSGQPTDAHPTKQVITLPKLAGAKPVTVTFQSITPTSKLSAANKLVCPTSGHKCSGQISVVFGNFAKYANKAHPIQVQIIAKWKTKVGPGKLFMAKGSRGAPVQLAKCVMKGGKYNTPCLKSEVVKGLAAKHNLITTSTILFVESGGRFARRV